MRMCHTCGQLFATCLLILSFVTDTTVKGEGIDSVAFMEGKSGHFFRNSFSSMTLQDIVLSKLDVYAAAAVLLGLEPPLSTNKDTAYKLDKLLSPNPFSRPHVVLMLTVKGLDTESMYDGGEKVGIYSVQQHKLSLEGSNPILEFPEDARLEILNNFTGDEQKLLDAEEELKGLCLFLGGSYQIGDESLRGTMVVPLPSGSTVSLQLSKKADQKFALELVSLYRSIRRAVTIRESREWHMSAEFYMGTFSGIEGLLEYHGSGVVSKAASELFIYTTAKLFVSMDRAYAGHVVGIIVAPSYGVQVPGQGHIDVKLTQRHAQLLDEDFSSIITTIAAELLAEKVIAWFVGILLIVMTIIGSCALFQMPLTRDTLLYSSVKLD